MVRASKRERSAIDLGDLPEAFRWSQLFAKLELEELEAFNRAHPGIVPVTEYLRRKHEQKPVDDEL